MSDRMHEECGVFGVFAHGEDVANLTYFGLYALQHRGQESAGHRGERRPGGSATTRTWAWSPRSSISCRSPGCAATSRSGIPATRRPAARSCQRPADAVRASAEVGSFLLAHNGNLTKPRGRARPAGGQGVSFASSSDTEIIGQLLTRTAGRNPR